MSWCPSRFWISVPENLLQLSQEEQLAWIWIASQIKATGKAPTNRAIRQLTGWGGGRVSRFLALVVGWSPAGTEPGQNRDRTGTEPGQNRDSQPATKADKSEQPGQNRDRTGTEPGQNRDRTGTVNQNKEPSTPDNEASKTDRSKQNQTSQEEEARLLRSMLGERVFTGVWNGGYRTREQLQRAEDRALRFLPGIGEPGLARIRDVLPKMQGSTTPRTKTRESLYGETE